MVLSFEGQYKFYALKIEEPDKVVIADSNKEEDFSLSDYALSLIK